MHTFQRCCESVSYTHLSCDIPQEMAEKYGIDIMSFHILLDDVDYVERVD